MLTGIDHVVLAVRDPAAAGDEVERALGLGATGGGRHEALGTRNRLVWLGDSYLELIGIEDRERASGSWIGAPALRVLDREEAGFVAIALASDALDADLDLLRSRASILRGPVAGRRTTSDGSVVRWNLALPPAIGPEDPVFLIEHEPGPEWDVEAMRARAVQVHPFGGTARLAAVQLAVPSVRRSMGRLARDVGLSFRPSLAGAGARDASVGDQLLRLVAARPDMPGAVVTIRAVGMHGRSGPATESAELFGCRFLVQWR
jgi:hypothetical protein